MLKNRDDEIRQLHDDVARRQYYQKNPQRIAESLSRLMARRGYAQLNASDERERAWSTVVGADMAAYSRVGNIRRGVMHVTVSNSTVLQELTFKKRELLEKIMSALPDGRIRDLRFRVGQIH